MTPSDEREIIHVLPINDLREHEESDKTMKCGACRGKGCFSHIPSPIEFGRSDDFRDVPCHHCNGTGLVDFVAPVAKRYRKKPILIEAFLAQDYFDGNAPSWFIDAINSGAAWMQGGSVPYLTIKTLEGEHRADRTDWIIKGIQGELYPCKPDIFNETYQEEAP